MISVEKLLLDVLRSAAPLGAVPAARIVTELSEGIVRPVIRVEASGGLGGTSAGPNWLDKPTAQVDGWGATKGEALAAVSAAYDAVLAAPRTDPVHVNGVAVYTTATLPVWTPDEDWPTTDGRPGPRYVMTVRVSAHPNA